MSGYGEFPLALISDAQSFYFGNFCASISSWMSRIIANFASMSWLGQFVDGRLGSAHSHSSRKRPTKFVTRGRCYLQNQDPGRRAARWQTSRLQDQARCGLVFLPVSAVSWSDLGGQGAGFALGRARRSVVVSAAVTGTLYLPSLNTPRGVEFRRNLSEELSLHRLETS